MSACKAFSTDLTWPCVWHDAACEHWVKAGNKNFCSQVKEAEQTKLEAELKAAQASEQQVRS